MFLKQDSENVGGQNSVLLLKMFTFKLMQLIPRLYLARTNPG